MADSTAETFPLMPFVWTRGFWFVDFSTHLAGPDIPLRIDQILILGGESRWVAVDHDRVVACCGSCNLQTVLEQRAYELHRSGEVLRLPDPITPHRNFGIIIWRNALHVFGGVVNKQCEMMSLAWTHWRRIPDMAKERTNFTPAIWKDAVYLCGGWDISIEVWDGHTMRMLTLQLPERQTNISFVWRNMLVVLSCNTFVYISSETSSSHVKKATASPLCNTLPVCYNGYFYAIWDKHLLKYDVTKGTVEKFDPEPAAYSSLY